MKKTFIASFLAISILSALFFHSAYAADFSFSDNFSGDFNIDKNLSNYKFASGTMAAADNSISSQVISSLLLNTSYNIGSAELEVSESFPADGRIVYYLSNDNGNTWVQAQKNVFVNFSSFGKQARWSAVIARADNNTASPEIHSIKITVRESDSALSASNDSRRISDLSTVASAISDFYTDYGVYPHVDGVTSEFRWKELTTLLSRNRNGGKDSSPYLHSPVNDPLNYLDNRSYDYKDISPNDYVLAAGLETPGNIALETDIDGSSSGIDCNDPVYCIGVLRNAGGFNQNSSGMVLGASTSIYGTSMSDLNSSVPAYDLNNMIGRPIFRRGIVSKTDFAVQTQKSNITAISNHPGNNNSRVAGASIAKAAGTATGTTGSLLLSAAISLMISLLYMAYTQTGLFKKREIQDIITKQHSDKNRFNFAL